MNTIETVAQYLFAEHAPDAYNMVTWDEITEDYRKVWRSHAEQLIAELAGDNATYTDEFGTVWTWRHYDFTPPVLFAAGLFDEDAAWQVDAGTPRNEEELIKAVEAFNTKYRPAKRDRVYLTLGEFREATSHLPDAVPITAGRPIGWEGDDWLNTYIEAVPKDANWPSGEEQYSIILGTRDDFDTRQW